MEVAVSVAEHARRPGVTSFSLASRTVEDLNHEAVSISSNESRWTGVVSQRLDRLDRHRPGGHVPSEHDQIDAGL